MENATTDDIMFLNEGYKVLIYYPIFNQTNTNIYGSMQRKEYGSM